MLSSDSSKKQIQAIVQQQRELNTVMTGSCLAQKSGNRSPKPSDYGMNKDIQHSLQDLNIQKVHLHLSCREEAPATERRALHRQQKRSSVDIKIPISQKTVGPQSESIKILEDNKGYQINRFSDALSRGISSGESSRQEGQPPRKHETIAVSSENCSS